ncbi:hypothetical protein [Flavobacterium filum]|uniref:hypothetical protein n=1 Tax=Flavobacterium filum TaxID=370974 RepID=UPI0023F246B7|nr:hypothetical protein [Flavobacterium filum]
MTALNSSLTTDLSEATAYINFDDLPDNQLNNYYQIRLDSYKLEDAKESRTLYSADVSIKFSFGLYNKDVTHYTTIIDDYIHSLMRMFKANNSGGARLPYALSGVSISKIEDLEASGLKEITNNFLQPEIKFKALVLDNNNVSLTPPSAPTLTSPIDTYANGTTGQSLNWTGTANSWQVKISTGSTVVILQAGIEVSSFTVPLDSLLTDGLVYSWTARGLNEAGYGSWATPFTFTVNDSPALPEVPSLTSPLGTTDNDLNVTFVWALSANSTSYDFQIASDAGFTTLLTNINVTATTSDYTFSANGTYYWRVRGVNGTGNSAWADSTVVILQFAYEAETVTLASRHTVAPDTTRKGHMNTLYAGLKTDALLDKIDVLQIYESHSVTSSDWGLNWRKNAHNAVSSATAVGTGINAPVTTNGSTSYIKTNYSPATEGVAYGRDRASMGYLLISTDTSSGFDVGYSGTAGVGYILLQARNGSTQYSSRLNTIAGAVISGAQNTSIAFHTFVRSDVNTVSYYRNSTLIQTSAAQTGSNVPAGEVWIGGSNALTFRAGSYGVFYAGGYLSATDVANLVSRLTTYITAIGGTV